MQDILKANGFKELPSYYFDKDIQELDNRIEAVNSDLSGLSQKISNKVNFIQKQGYQFVESNAKVKGPQPGTKEQINTFNALSIYSKNLSELYTVKKSEKYGSGLFNPQELLRRFELLNGSLTAGNNGVLPEFIQIAHRLRDLGILSNNQLNTLLRKVV